MGIQANQAFRVAEVNYINNIGNWRATSIFDNIGRIASSTSIEKQETVCDDTIQLLENYIYWAPFRRWPNDEWEYFYNYASARLARLKKATAKPQK